MTQRRRTRGLRSITAGLIAIVLMMTPTAGWAAAEAIDAADAAAQAAGAAAAPDPAEESGGSSAASAAPTPSPTSPAESGTTEPAPVEATAPSDPAATEAPAAEPSGEPTDEPTTEPTESAAAPAAAAAEIAPLALVPGKATLVLHTGGDRTGDQTAGTIPGVVFDVYAGQENNPPTIGTTPVVTSCTTDATGTCEVYVDPASGGGGNPNGYWMVQRSAPSGWTNLTTLDTGGGSPAAANYWHFSGNVAANTSYDLPFTSTGNSNYVASSGQHASARVNPGVAPKCGLRIAVLVDLSASVAGNITNLRSAGKGFVDALTGTPSEMAVYTFAGGAPASGTSNFALHSLADTTSANQVKSYFDSLNTVSTGDWRQGTNWDQGLWQIAQSGITYDMVLVLTDGNPTYYGPNHEGPGGGTRFREMENSVFSANAIKAKGTKIVAAGIGSSISGSVDNLKAVSGPTSGDDYFTTSFAQLEQRLTALAAANCNGTISVVKKVIPSGGTSADAQPAGGWTFSTGTADVTPASAVTAPSTGAVNFDIAFGAGTTKAVTIDETQQPGYTLTQVSGFNAVCTAGGTALPVTNAGATGFTVTASATQTVTCTVVNQAPNLTARVQVEKNWVIDGTPYTDAARPNGFSANLQLTGQSTPQFSVFYSGYHQNDVVTIGETTSVPPGCTVVPSGDLGQRTLAAGDNSYSLLNTVTCQTKLTLVKTTENGFGTPASPTAWTLAATRDQAPAPTASGVTGSAAVTSFSVDPGLVYVLTESGGTAGYAQEKVAGYNPNPALSPQPTGSWHCRIDGALTDYDGLNGGVTVQRGQSVTCTAINRAVAPKLTLVKAVDNGTAGGTAQPTDWTLTAKDPSLPLPSLTGTTGGAGVTAVMVTPGVAYQLAESGPSGYTQSSLQCVLTGSQTQVPVTASAVTATLGQDITCTFVNTAQQARLTLVKQVSGQYADPATAWTLTAAGGAQTITGATGSAPVTQAAVVPGGYTLSESGPTTGYSASAWQCTDGSGPVTVTGSTVQVALGQQVVCTITNTAQSTFLGLFKTVVNDHGGQAVATDWTLRADGPTALVDTGDVSGLVAPGVYTLSEQGPAGYAQSSLACWVNGSQPHIPVPVVGGQVTLARGASVMCEFVNDDQPSTLTLVKIVDPGEAGTVPAEPSDWTLTAAGQGGAPTVAGPSGSAAVTSIQVPAGSYTLSEDGPSGYAPGTWECTAGIVTGDRVVVPNGVDVTCRITNTAVAPKLTLVKEVENTHGGTATAADFLLGATGPSLISGYSEAPEVTAISVEAGVYNLFELAVTSSGYDLTSLICVDATRGSIEVTAADTITLAPGDDVTCRFVNSDLPATLTLTKTVDPGSAGLPVAAPTAWTLTATGPTPSISGPTGTTEVTGRSVSAGVYQLTESGPAGYTAGQWVCTGAAVTGSAVTVPVGATVTCAIVNTAIAPTITLLKTVINDDGGTATDDQWTLSATGPVAASGTTGTPSVTDVPVQSGTYAITESGPSGYQQTSLTCTIGGQPATVTAGAIDLGPGDVAVCRLVNDDQPGTLTLLKEVEGNETTGGQAAPTDWTVTAANGPVTISGEGTTGDQTVPAGTYTLTESPARPSDPVTAGYTPGSWTCTVGEQNVDASAANVAVAVGQHVVCRIVNTAQPTQWKVIKTSDPESGATVVPGQAIDYTVTVTHLAGVAARDVVVTDDLSDVLDNAQLTAGPNASAGTAELSGTTVTWQLPVLSDEETMTYTAVVDPGQLGVTLRNVVTRGDEPCQPESGDVCTTEHFTPSWTITKSSDPASGSVVDPGGTIVYTLSVVNTSAVPVDDLVITDDLTDVADDASIGAITTTTGTATATDATTITWQIPTLPADGVTYTASYTATVHDDAWDRTIRNVVTGSGEVPPTDCAAEGRLGGLAAENCGTDHETPPKPTITLIKSVDNGLRRDGLALPADWTLTAAPGGESEQPTVSGPGGFGTTAVLPGTYVLSEIVTTGANPRGYSAGDWECSVVTGDSEAQPREVLQGAVQVDIGDAVTCRIVNRAINPDLGIVKSHAPLEGEGEVIADPDKGQQYRYTLQATNLGTDPATDVVVTDTLPTSLIVDPASVVAPAGWTTEVTQNNPDGTGATLTFRFPGPFDPAATADFTFVVTVGSVDQPDPTVAAPDIVNQACVSSAEPDLNPDNDCDVDNVPVKSIVLSAAAVCRADVPYLDYSIQAMNFTPETVTVYWWNTEVWNNGDPTGDPSATSVIPIDQLSGTLLWPGAVLDANGKIIEWPGWRDGGTVEDPTAPGGDLRPSAVVQVVSNPSIDSATVYPPPTPFCNANPPTRTVDPPQTPTATAAGFLPQTGAQVGGLLAGALGALVLGWWLTRRSRRDGQAL